MQGDCNTLSENGKKITNNTFIIKVITGYRLQLTSTPTQNNQPVSTPSSTEELQTIQTEINTLLQKQAIVQVQPQPDQFVSKIFVVPKRTGGKRVIIDLRELNLFIKKIKFRMENHILIQEILNKNDYMTSIDLTDAYLMIPIHPEHRKYLCFQWQNIRYQYTCLPFGLTSAPRIFTKVLKIPMAYARRRGITCTSYIDDIFNKASQADCCHHNTQFLITLLRRLGFLPNIQKSHLTPTRELVHLGKLYNTQEMVVRVPQAKLQNISNTALSTQRKSSVSLRQIAHILGLMEDARAAMTIAASHYRGLQQQLTQNIIVHPWDHQIILNQVSLADLHWWAHKATNFNGRPIQTIPPDRTIQSDASLEGWGAVFGNQTAQGRWTKEEKNLHINILELMAAKLALQSFLQNQSNLHVKIQLDNTTAVAYIKHQGGSKSHILCKIALQIWNFCERRNISLTAQFLPGQSNNLADT